MNAPKKARNSFGIPFLRTGPANLISVINQIIAALDAVRARPSADIDPLVTDDGTLLTLRNSQTGATQSRFSEPWTPYDASTETELRVGFYPGFVDGEPPKVAGTPINSTPAPYLVITASTGFYLRVTVSATDTKTSYDIISSTSVPASTYVAGTGGFIYLQLSNCTVLSGRIFFLTPPRVLANLEVGVGGGIWLWTSY